MDTKALEEPEVVMVEDDSQLSEKEATVAEDSPVKRAPATTATLPTPVTNMQITAVCRVEGMVTAQPETSCRLRLELVD